MTSRDFAYWLQGFAELSAAPPTSEQWTAIRNHLNLVFVHEIDPSMPDPSGKLQAAHDGAPKKPTTGIEVGTLKAELAEMKRRIPTVDIVALVEQWRPIVAAVQYMGDFDTIHSTKVTTPDGVTHYLSTYAQSLPAADEESRRG